jgi:hypothetical protein
MKNNIQLIVFLVAVFISHSALSNSNTPASNVPANSVNSIFFKENKGQVCDQKYTPRADILFSGYNDGFSFFLKGNGISYQLQRIDNWKEEQNIRTKEINKIIDQVSFYRIDVEWLNANSNTNISKGEALGGYNNYYLEQCPNGVLEVMSYKSITYRQLYKGIDLKWHVNEGNLKYDYLIGIGADYKQIKLKINGATNISITMKGELLIKTPFGDFIEDAPLVTQNGKTLKSKWVLYDQIAGFEIENVDYNKELIIDPAIRLWSTYFGGSSYEIPFYNKTDQAGNVYITGHSASVANIATTGSHQVTFGGAGTSFGDAFIAKYNSSGVLQWSTYYGGSGNDFGSTPSIDVNGNIFLVGGTTCATSNVISTPGAHQTTFGGGSNWGDAFLVKFNSSGVRQWGTYFGGSGDDYGDGSAIDASGNVYIAGVTKTNVSSAIATTGAHQTTYGGGVNDGFMAKFNGLGVCLWSSYYGGTGDDFLNGCVCDTANNVYFCGYTSSVSGTFIATQGSHQQIFNGGLHDGLLVKFDSLGTRLWGTYYGGTGDDLHVNITISGNGDLFIGGFTSSLNDTSIATPNSHQSSYGGGTYDCFVAKFRSSGIRDWASYYGGLGADLGGYCTLDLEENVYLAGRTNTITSNFISTPCSYQRNYGGGISDVFLAKFTSTGSRLWGTYYGGSGTEDFPACTCDYSGNVYLSAPTSSSIDTVIASPGSSQPIYGGGLSDAFLAKFDGCIAISPLNSTPPQNMTICSGNNTMLNTSLTCGANWFNTPTGGTSIFFGNTFTTPNLTATETFYIEENSCGVAAPRTAVTVTVVICTNTPEITRFDTSIIVYPNPSSDKIFIKCKKLDHLVILNSIGQQVANVIGASDDITEVDISQLTSGIYFLRVLVEDKMFNEKIFIRK